MFVSKSNSSENVVLSFFKGLIIAIVLSFGLIILLAFSLKWFSIEDKMIMPLNLAIKTISVFVGSCIAIKRGSSKGLIKGVLFGIIYTGVAIASFSLLANTFIVDLSLLLDFVFASIAGGIVGIIKVNRN